MALPIDRTPLSIVAGYLGILSVTLVLAPLALAAGLLAIVEIRRRPKARGMGRALFAVITGGLGTALLILLLTTGLLR